MASEFAATAEVPEGAVPSAVARGLGARQSGSPSVRACVSGVLLTAFFVTACACQKRPDEPSSSTWSPATSEASTAAAPSQRDPAGSTAITRTLVDSSALTVAPGVVASAGQRGDAARCIAPPNPRKPAPVKPGPDPTCPADPAKPFPLAKVVIAFPDADTTDGSAKVTVTAELAAKPAETERGLMYRRAMPEDAAMLFDLGPRRAHSFWMRNTCIPLDMLFVDDDGLIVGILENVPTMNDEERSVGCPSSWVLETNAGWSRRHGVRAGQRLELPSRSR